MKILDRQDVLRRAHADWARKSGGAFRACSARHVELHGLEYVALFVGADLVAVYRVRPAGQLKRLKQYPAEVENVLKRTEPTDRGFSGAPNQPEHAVDPDTAPDSSTSSDRPLRDHPELLGFRLELMRWRRLAAKAGNEEWVERLDKAIEITKKA